MLDVVCTALGVAGDDVVAAAEEEGVVVRVRVSLPATSGGAVASATPLAVPELIKKLAAAPALEAVATPVTPAMVGSCGKPEMSPFCRL